jgi:hypothetical protein
VTYQERRDAESAAWWSALRESEVRGRMDGAWNANDPDGYANARAELRRRRLGGSWASHVTTHDAWVPV